MSKDNQPEKSNKDADPKCDKDNAAKSPASPPQQAKEFDNFWAEFDLDDLNLFPPDAKIYKIKVHTYKEIKHYIKGEKLGQGKFGTVREFVDKNTLKRYAG